MIEVVAGNLLDAQVEALVNTVNTVGVMGKGIALQFRQAFPDNYEAYRRACQRKEVRPGEMFVFKRLTDPRFIINFPTKRHWKQRSRMSDIESGLRALVDLVQREGIQSIAVPPLGSGSGGLDWGQVRPKIEQALGELAGVRVLLYQPKGAPAAESMKVATERPKMTPGRAVLIRLMQDYSIPGYRLQLLEVQKLAYFLQALGQPLKLEFCKARYGPYAEALEHVLQRIEAHFVRGYGDRSGGASIRLLPGAAQEAQAFLRNDAETLARLGRVSSLIEGFETPYGMELLATVHWAALEESNGIDSLSATIEAVHSWSSYKQRTFTPDHIRVAWGHLRERGWLDGDSAH